MSSPAPAPRRTRLILTAAVALSSTIAFWPVLRHDFVVLDDARYVTENPEVQDGLSWHGLRWSLTTFHGANWHPLTWLSHQLDWQLFGASAAGHHATSLALHVANSVLLFLLFTRLTGEALRSALVAALFGVHPLHVEAVAWVAQRKELLSTMFWLLALAGWVSHVRAPSVGRYVLVVLAMGGALGAKPMAVTLPFTLLLLDYWPLERLSAPALRARLWEKLPLFALALASSLVTLAAQRAGGALAPLELYPLGVRLGNAIVAYATYLSHAFWPAGLAVPYPHPGADLAAGKVLLCALLLAALTLVAWRSRRTRPHWLWGWLWFGGTLVPVIGLVQVGSQALADRYTYVPLIGLFVAVVFSLPRAVGPLAPVGTAPPAATADVRRDTPLLAIALWLVPLLIVLSRVQLGHWRDDITLMERALAVTRDNAVAHNQLGLDLARRGDVEQALAHYHEALEISPRFAEAHNNLAGALVEQGDVPGAITHYQEALRHKPAYPEARLNLGVALVRVGRTPEAVEEFREALRLRPGYGKAHANLAAAYLALGDIEHARSEIREAQRTGFDPPETLVEALGAGGAP